KFTSTPYGVKPLRSDLMMTLRRGVAGTSMPSFRLLPDADIEAVVDYVILLSRRGELQRLLAGEAESSEELDDDVVTEYVDVVAGRWKDAGTLSTASLTPQPELTPDRAQQGRQAFLESGCSKCHGEDGRGHTKDNIGQDAWGFPTRAADLTSGMLRGGQEPMDIYRRILNGINGTPMPGFRSVLEADPERAWNLVSYVLEISGRRREDTRAGRSGIPAGLIKPYLAAPPADPAADTDSSAE
ncbi:MAG: c-type cytochrome, partial [Planctomycetota bacterium]